MKKERITSEDEIMLDTFCESNVKHELICLATFFAVYFSLLLIYECCMKFDIKYRYMSRIFFLLIFVLYIRFNMRESHALNFMLLWKLTSSSNCFKIHDMTFGYAEKCKYGYFLSAFDVLSDKNSYRLYVNKKYKLSEQEMRMENLIVYQIGNGILVLP